MITNKQLVKLINYKMRFTNTPYNSEIREIIKIITEHTEHWETITGYNRVIINMLLDKLSIDY